MPHPLFILFVLVWVYFCFAICKTEHYLLAVFLIGLSVPAASIVSDMFDDSRRAMNQRRRRRIEEDEEVAASDPTRPMRLEPILSNEDDASNVEDTAGTRPRRWTNVEPSPKLKVLGLLVMVVLNWTLVTIIIGQVLIDSPQWLMLFTPQSLTLIILGTVLSLPFIGDGRESRVRLPRQD